MKFDRSNKFDFCNYGQVNSLRLISSVASKWASKHLLGSNIYFGGDGTWNKQKLYRSFIVFIYCTDIFLVLKWSNELFVIMVDPCNKLSVVKLMPITKYHCLSISANDFTLLLGHWKSSNYIDTSNVSVSFTAILIYT